MNAKASVSVRNLVEFILRSGDIDNRKNPGSDPDAMQEGIRIHQKIQKAMPPGYHAEYSLSESFDDGGIFLTVEGRADGVWEKDEGIFIDEIKSMYADLSYIDSPKELHLAQAKCYAAIYAGETGTDRIGVQITYCDIDTEEIKRFRYSYDTPDLRAWLSGIVSEYCVWLRMRQDSIEKRNGTVGKLDFPFAYRKGQKELARDVYRTILRSRNLFIQAPTGVGKTLSVLFPSLKSMGEGLTDKLFYVTAKTVTASVAEDTFRLLMRHGLSIKAIHITAKEKSCANDTFACNPDACPYADGHYDRINKAVFDIISNESIITREIILDYAEKHRVCPYEFSLDISEWCDAIIGDYNYVFDPRVRLRRYFSDGADRGNYVVLIDEAHNLVQRAMEMYSAEIIKEDVLGILRLTKGMDKRLSSALTSLNRKLLELKRECEGEYTEYDDIGQAAASAGNLFRELSRFLEKQRYFEYRDEVLEFFFQIKTFCDVYSGDLSGYRIYGKIRDDGSFLLKLLCVDPSEPVSGCLSSARTGIFFSATLLPVGYYKELLTGNPDDYAVYAETSFRQEQRFLAMAGDVSTKYSRRNEEEYRRIAGYITGIVEARDGNYMVFFPSYDFLSRVSAYLDLNTVVQSRNMTESEKDAFLEKFNEENGETLVGLCVMGGVFSEGIDLTDEKLIGAIIVGTGLPMINTESEIIKEHFDRQKKDGFAYAYRYPGLNKVLQAAGRVIRKETDRGVIILLDERFAYSENRRVFPREWDDMRRVTAESVRSELKKFWKH